MSTNPVGHNTRNLGIDLLRIVSMLMVVILHILGQGGILKAAKPLSAGYEIAWFLEILCYCAVNCYALISGYVGVSARFKYSNIVYIWLQVFFYSAGIAAVAAAISPDININAVIRGFFPVTTNFYWYFTAYFCIFFFIPLFNRVINSLNEKQLKATGITVFIIFSVLQIFAGSEIFFTNRGYSALWLALLYILGGILKKTEWLKNLKGYTLALLFFGVCAITWFEKFIVESINEMGLTEKALGNSLVSYISPTILLAAVFLLVAFSKIKTSNVGAKLIAFLAPFSFGVYLIHVHKQIWRHLMKNGFTYFAELHWAVLPLAVIGSAVAIFIVCALVDFLRDKLFKVLKIKELLIKAETKLIGDLWSQKN